VFDIEGVFREKRLPVALLQRYLHQGWSFIDALPYWGPNDATRADMAFRSEPCRLDAGSLRPYPFEANAALIVADFTGASAALSPRTLLSRQVERARALGFEACGASEFEFILLNETPDTLEEKAYGDLRTHAQENRCWSGLYPASGAEFLREYDACLRAADIPLHHICAELGPGCLESALPVRPLPSAADDAALFKLFTKAFSIRKQLVASFMAQLSDAHPGLGGHPIISLRAVDSGAEAFYDERSEDRLTPHLPSFHRWRPATAAGADADVREHGQCLPALRARQLGAAHGDLGLRQLHLRLARGRGFGRRVPHRIPPARRGHESASRVRHAARRRSPRHRTAHRAAATDDGNRSRARAPGDRSDAAHAARGGRAHARQRSRA
jgi:hypothetical protein